MTHVLYIITSLKRSGPVNILFDLVKYLNRPGYKTHVITLCSEDIDSRLLEFVSIGINVTCANLGRGFGFITSSFKIRSIVQQVNPDIIHCFGFRADILGAFFLHDYKKISSQLNYPFEDYVMTYGKFIGSLMAFVTICALRRFSYIVACSNDVSIKLSNFGLNPKVVFNAIDDSRFTAPSLFERKELLHSLKLWNDAEIIFIFVGVLTERKQPLIALKAFSEFQILHPNAAMIVLGDGPAINDCKLIASGMRVHFAGKVSDTRPYLAISDVYIATSKAEGMPVSVIEALAMRLPVILSDINPHREILHINDKAGFLVRVGSISDTVCAMMKFIDCDKSFFAGHARSIVDLELSAGVMSDRFFQLYDSLTKSKTF